MIQKTIQAILTNFDEPLIKEYNIPSAFRIKEALVHAIKEICLINFQKSHPFYDLKVEWDLLAFPEKLQPRIRQAISLILDNGYLEKYLLIAYEKNQILKGKWFFFFGDMFVFEDYEKEKIKQELKEFWTEQELENFKEIHKIMITFLKKDLSLSWNKLN